MRLEREVDLKTVSELIGLMIKPGFGMDMFRRYIKSVGDCEEIVSRGTKEMIEKDRFKRVVRKEGSGKDEIQGPLYFESITEILGKQVELCRGGEDIVFRPGKMGEDIKVKSPSMGTKCFERCYGEVKKEVMGSFESGDIWNERRGEGRETFVGFAQIFSDKTATSRKGSALVAYPVHAVLLNLSIGTRQWLIDQGHALVAFLPVCTGDEEMEEDVVGEGREVSVYRFTSLETVPLEDGARVVGKVMERERRMRMIYRAMKMVVWPLEKYERSGFQVKTREGLEWKCVPLLVSYCCDISEGKDISAVRHGVAVRRPCVRCMVTGEDIIAGRRSDIRSMEDTRRVRRIVCSGRDGSDERDRMSREGLVVGKRESGCALLKSYSLSKWPSFLEEMMGRGGKVGTSTRYSRLNLWTICIWEYPRW